MTYEMAMQKLEAERKVIEQAQSDLQSARALFTLGEYDKAGALFAAVRHSLRRTFTGQ